MLGADLAEAKARAVRALYETSDPHDRVDALASALARWRYLGDRIGIRAVAEALPREVPALDVFLDDWIARLRPAARGELPRDDRVLLVEAAAWRDGPDGVGALAAEHGAEHPELFVDWVDALIGAGRSGDAADACAQALAAMPALGEPRAQIAERLATLSTAAADRLDAARQAWRAAPTALRLRRLAALGDDTTLAAEADALERTDAPVRLGAALLVLAGRVDEATTILNRAEPLGWSSADHPGPHRRRRADRGHRRGKAPRRLRPGGAARNRVRRGRGGRRRSARRRTRDRRAPRPLSTACRIPRGPGRRHREIAAAAARAPPAPLSARIAGGTCPRPRVRSRGLGMPVAIQCGVSSPRSRARVLEEAHDIGVCRRTELDDGDVAFFAPTAAAGDVC